MMFDYVMATMKNGDRHVITYAKPQELAAWLFIEDRLKEVSTISFHYQGKPLINMTVFA